MALSEEELREYIGKLVETGIEVRVGKSLLYKSSRGNYTILVFDSKSNLQMDKEENFDILSDAVGKFILQNKSKINATPDAAGKDV